MKLKVILLIAVCGVLLSFCLYLYNEQRNLKIQEELIIEKNKQEINIKEEQALRTLNPLICQSIENEGKKDSCVEQIEQSVESLREINPVYLGSLFFQAGNYNDAIDVYESAITNENEYVDVRTYLAIASAYSEKGIMKHQEEICFPKALEWVDKAVALEPNNPEVYRVKGYVYETKPDFISAIDNYNKSLEISSSYIPAYIGRCHAYSLFGFLGRALEDCQKAVDLDVEKRFSIAHLHLCRLKLSILDKQDEAIEACQVVIDSTSANGNDKSTAFQMMATVKINQDKPNEVLSLLQQAIFYAPQDPNNYLTLAIFYNKKENFEEAKKNIQKTIEIDSKKAVAFGELGYAYLKTNEIDKASENFSQAIRLIAQDSSLLVSSKENYKNKYCGYLREIYQEKEQTFEEPLCQ